MERIERNGRLPMLITILTWGSLWGIFEATVGYILHLIPLSIGWLVWYPVSCFFMFGLYRKTKRTEAIVLVGLLSACIKLFNLFLPGRIDRVLNPAVSIIFEAITMAAVFWMAKKYNKENKNTFLKKALIIFCMNTTWRILYAFYLLFFVPNWMREISVIKNTEEAFMFFVVYNIITTMLLFGAVLVGRFIFKPIDVIENKITTFLSSKSTKSALYIKTAVAVCLLFASIALELLI